MASEQDACLLHSRRRRGLGLSGACFPGSPSPAIDKVVSVFSAQRFIASGAFFFAVAEPYSGRIARVFFSGIWWPGNRSDELSGSTGITRKKRASRARAPRWNALLYWRGQMGRAPFRKPATVGRWPIFCEDPCRIHSGNTPLNLRTVRGLPRSGAPRTQMDFSRLFAEHMEGRRAWCAPALEAVNGVSMSPGTAFSSGSRDFQVPDWSTRLTAGCSKCLLKPPASVDTRKG